MSSPADLMPHGLLALILFQVGKTAREWIRGKRWYKSLLSEVREAREAAEEARIQAASTNRKLYALELDLEDKGIKTPRPDRPPRRSGLDPVTMPGVRNPLLGEEEDTKPGGKR